MADAINFLVDGLEPVHDPTWMTATTAQRAAYMRVCRILVLTEWDKQTAAGIGAGGKKLRALSKKTKRYRHSEMGPADKNAPPLIPAYALSRTRSLVDARTMGTKVKVYWKFDPISGKRWGVILGYHRDGKGHLPKRNVFGLSPAAKAAVLEQAHRWWAAYSRGLTTRMPTRPRPGKPARPLHAVLPPRERKEPFDPGVPKSPPAKTEDIVIGRHIFTTSKGVAEDLFKSIGGKRFTGFKSFAK